MMQIRRRDGCQKHDYFIRKCFVEFSYFISIFSLLTAIDSAL